MTTCPRLILTEQELEVLTFGYNEMMDLNAAPPWLAGLDKRLADPDWEPSMLELNYVEEFLHYASTMAYHRYGPAAGESIVKSINEKLATVAILLREQ